MRFRFTPRRRVVFLSLFLATVLAGLGLAGYLRWRALRYERFREAFEVGTAALEAGLTERAGSRLDEAVRTLPEEPAAWANRGLFHLRNSNLPQATADLAQAHRLAPESPEIEALQGLLVEKQLGSYEDAAGHYRQAVERDPDNVYTLNDLARVLNQVATPEAEAEAQSVLERCLKVQPGNYIVLRERTSLAIRRKDRAAVLDSAAAYRRLSGAWKGKFAERARESLDQFTKLAGGEWPDDLFLTFLQIDTILTDETEYQKSVRRVERERDLPGRPLLSFLRLPPPPRTFAPADFTVRFGPAAPLAAVPVAAVAGNRWDAGWPVWLRRSEAAVFVANATEARRADADAPALPFPGTADGPGGRRRVPPSPFGLLAVDWNNDFRTDLLLAGAGGLRFYEARVDGGFADVTARTGLPRDVLSADYFGAWAADYDQDGDLDLIVAPREGPVLVLRNNNDGTFTPVRPFGTISGVIAFAWADLDNDGASDAALVDGGGVLHVFANERLGVFHDRPAPEGLGPLWALAVADVNDDGLLDLLALGRDGAIVRVSDRDRGKSWEVAELARWENLPGTRALEDGHSTYVKPGEFRLFVADLDNNGAPDLVVTAGKDLVFAQTDGARAWLGDGSGGFRSLAAVKDYSVFGVADRDRDGRLDLLAFHADTGHPVQLLNRGSRAYGWVQVWFEMSEKEETKPDQRVNSFCIGSEVEVRTGTLVQKHPVAAPQVHIGLGEYKSPQLLRVVWTNGIPQTEFDLSGEVSIPLVQRLKGSCPFLYAFDGTGIRCVTDCVWSTPLGMYVNGQDKGGFLQTEEWVKIRGDQLVARDGVYDVRVGANLWETHYFDRMRLRVVDHPPGTEVYSDERFFLTPTPPRLYVTGSPRPVSRALDHRGSDVTDLVAKIDGRYLDRATGGRYQGIAGDHWVEFDLGDDAPKDGPVYLVATGFIRPTDSSINVAITQGHHEPPQGLVLEVPDGKGGWKVGRPALGFPAGKNKTAVIRLDGIDGPGVSRRCRLRTNLEIYWDALAYARGLGDDLALVTDLAPESAELRHRGVVAVSRADRSSPEMPDYDTVVSTGQYWRDLEGYYTRYGDVRELLAKADDRYAILNAGDEIAFRYRAPEDPPPGWKRDFVWVTDGWVKDGDFNTRFSKTVLPLPEHGPRPYDRPPGRLEDDPVYRRFPDDWKNYHTRYVTPAGFEQGLRSRRFQRP